MAVSKGMYADSDTAANVAVQERSDTDRAQHDYETYRYGRPAPDRNYSRHRSTADLKAADYSLSDVCDLGGDEELCRLLKSQEMLNSTGETDLDTLSTGIGEARMSIPGEEEVTQLSRVAVVKAITDAYIDSRRGPMLAESTVRSRASDVQDSAGARAQHSLESSRGTLYHTVHTDVDTRSAEFGEAEETARADDVMAMLTHIATVTGVKAAVAHSCRGAAVASPFVIGGGMLFGPVGIFIGGTVGGLIAWMTSEDFKSVPQVLMELSPAERQKLSSEAMAVVKNFDWKDAAELIKFVMANSFIRGKVLGVLNTYVAKKLKAKPKYTK